MVSRSRLNARKRRSRAILISVAIVAVGATIVGIYAAVSALNVNSGTALSINKPVSGPVLNELTHVSNSMLVSSLSASNVAAPQNISSSPLFSAGKPEVLYIGGEYCPYCGIERWSMVIALSRFGNFSNLEYMVSSSSDVPSSIPTFTFRHSNYTSDFISFVAVEKYDRSGAVVQQPSSDQQTLFATFDSSGSIPFIDIGGALAVVGAQVSPGPISGMNWTQVANQLSQPGSLTGNQIDKAAAYLISSICLIDGSKPSSVCGQAFATRAPTSASIQLSAPDWTTMQVSATERRTWTG